jgi:hypothetical protein
MCIIIENDYVGAELRAIALAPDHRQSSLRLTRDALSFIGLGFSLFGVKTPTTELLRHVRYFSCDREIVTCMSSERKNRELLGNWYRVWVPRAYVHRADWRDPSFTHWLPNRFFCTLRVVLVNPRDRKCTTRHL